MTIFDRTTKTINGRDFEVTRYYDTDHGAPWKEEDGHGPVRESRTRHGSGYEHSDKRPGERPLNFASRGETQYYYDWAAALKQAAREGWGLSDEARAELTAKLGRTPTAREVRAAAVARDFDWLRGWLADEWCYIGVAVRLIVDGEPVGDEYTHALWGIESEGDYWEEVAQELASECLAQWEREHAPHWDRFDICEAWHVLESDYNKGGWLQERPSNQRRREACSVQLHRMNFRASARVQARGFEGLTDNGKAIYRAAVRRLGLPQE